MKLVRKYWLSIIINVFILLIFLVVLKQLNLNLTQLKSGFQSLSLSAILATLFLIVFVQWLYACRVACILQRPMAEAFWMSVSGHAFNNIIPFRVGDVCRVLLAKKMFNMPASQSLFSLGLEHSVDFSAVLLFATLALTTAQLAIQQQVNFSINIYYVLPVLITLLLFLRWQPTAYRKIYCPLLAFVRDVLAQVTTITWKKVLSILLYSIAIWSCTLLMFYTFFNLSNPIPFSVMDSICLLILTTMALFIPSMIAGLGLFESGIVFYLVNQYDIAIEVALAQAIVFHLLILTFYSTFVIILLVKFRQRVQFISKAFD